MKKIKKKIYDIFQWNIEELIKAIVGIILFSFAINVFIVPNDLYSSGVLGFAQVLRTIILKIFKIKTEIDISGLINFAINIPLFIIAYKSISKSNKTCYC